MGYATGYVTSLFGQLVVFREVECRSMGASVCRVIGRHAAAWGDVSEDLRYLQAQRLPPPGDAAPATRSARLADVLPARRAGRERALGATGTRSSARRRPSTRPATSSTRVARTQATVLFTGESGVGKEVFAQPAAPHQRARATSPSSRSTARRSPRR